MRYAFNVIAVVILAIPAFGQSVTRPDTLDWRGYYPLDIGTTWEWHVKDYVAGELMNRQRIESDTVVDGHTWMIQSRYVEGSWYGESVARHDSLLLRYDEPFGRVLARSPVTGEEYDLTCDLSGEFGEEVLCGAELGDPSPIVFEGGYAEAGANLLQVGSDAVRFAAHKQDPVIYGSVPPVYYHGVGRLEQPGDGFNGTINFTYLQINGIEYGSRASFVGTEQPNNSMEMLEVFPNPVASTLTIKFGVANGPAALRVYDLLGRLQLSHSRCTSPCQIDVRTLAPGTYLLDLEFEAAGRSALHVTVLR